MKPINLRGKKFGRLKVISYDWYSQKTGHAYWYCKCVCGEVVRARGSHLRSGNTQSCGCLNRDVCSTKKFRKKMSEIQKGNSNSNWVGDSAKYSTIHDWLRNNYAKLKCDKCNRSRNLDWALIRGKKHARNRMNYLILCRSCHLKYDRWKLSTDAEVDTDTCVDDN